MAAETRQVTYKVVVETADGKREIDKFKTTMQTMSQSSDKAEKSMQKLADSLTKQGQVARVTTVADKEVGQQMKANHRESVRTAKAMNALTNEYAHLESRLGRSADEQEVLNAQFRLGKNATKAQRDEVERLVTAYQKQRSAATKTQGSMRGLRGQAQNLGWQLQDVAVQAQMGTSALVILGQQGSQLASGFGATGALIGAGIAVLAAAAGVLTSSASAANAKAKDLSETTSTLASNFDKLNKSQKETLTRSLQQSFRDKAIEAQALQNKVNELTTALINANRSANGRFFDRILGSDPDKINAELIKTKATLTSIIIERDKLEDQLKDPSGKKEEDKSATTEKKNNLDDYIRSLSESAAMHGLSAREIAEYTLNSMNATDADRERVSGILDVIEANEKKDKSEADATASLNKSLSEQAKLQQNHINTLAKYTDEGKLIKLNIQYAKERELLKGNNSALLALDKQYANDKIKITGSVWEQYAAKARDEIMNTDTLMIESLDRFTSGFGDAISNAIFESDNLGQAMANIFKDVGKNMVGFFAEWAAQKVALWVLDQTLSKADRASEAATLGAEAQAMSFLAAENAYAGAAATPIVGMALAPAAAATALAVTQGMASTVAGIASTIPAMDKGGRIPSGGAGIVSEFGDELVGGTMVYNGSPNSLAVTGREQTARMTNNKTSNNITINSNGNASPDAIARSLVRTLKRAGKNLDTAVFDSMNRGSNNRGKRFA